MKKESATIEVNGKSVKATKISYVFDKESTQNLINSVVDKLLENDEFITKVASISSDIEKDDVKEELKEMKDSVKEIDFKKEAVFSIYIKGLLNDTVGYSIEYDGNDYLTIFKDGNTTEINYDNHAKDFGKEKFNILVEEKNGEKEATVTATLDGKTAKLATFVIRSFDKKKVDLDYTIYLDKNLFGDDLEESLKEIPFYDSKEIPNITGTLKFEQSSKKNEYTSDMKFTLKWDKYINLDVTEKLNNKSRGERKGLDASGEFAISMNLFDVITMDLDGKLGTAIGTTIESANLEGNYKVAVNLDKSLMKELTEAENYVKAEISGTYDFGINDKGVNSFDTTGAINGNELNEEEFMNKLEEAINKDEKLKKLYDFIKLMEEPEVDDI